MAVKVLRIKWLPVPKRRWLPVDTGLTRVHDDEVTFPHRAPQAPVRLVVRGVDFKIINLDFSRQMFPVTSPVMLRKTKSYRGVLIPHVYKAQPPRRLCLWRQRWLSTLGAVLGAGQSMCGGDCLCKHFSGCATVFAANLMFVNRWFVNQVEEENSKYLSNRSEITNVKQSRE